MSAAGSSWSMFSISTATICAGGRTPVRSRSWLRLGLIPPHPASGLRNRRGPDIVPGASAETRDRRGRSQKLRLNGQHGSISIPRDHCASDGEAQIEGKRTGFTSAQTATIAADHRSNRICSGMA